MTLTLKDVLFKEWKGENFRAINQFYRRQKHKGSASGQDRVFIIEHDEQLIAAVRLVPFEGYYWLRGLYVDTTLQGKHLGSKLLEFVNISIQDAIYCFPYSHLDGFYQNAGYELVSIEELPNNMMQLYERHQKKSQSIIVMAKIGSNNVSA